MSRVLTCPQCNAPLKPHRFSRSALCSFCGTTVWLDDSSISADRFHAAFLAWNSPLAHSASSILSLGDAHWALDGFLASGGISDVYLGRRARYPTERAVIKLLRDEKDAALFGNEWEILLSLQRSQAPGAETFATLLPQPIQHGLVTAGEFTGRHTGIFRRPPGSHHTLQEVIRAFPSGIPPRASVWVWRRMLESLAFIHASGMVHGALLPPNILIQENEHGARLVGFSRSGAAGKSLQSVPQGFEPYYPASILSPHLDISMSARCITALLGGDARTASLPDAVPAPLAALVGRIALSRPQDADGQGAWALREQLGTLAGQVFGPPQFCPIVMPA